MIRSHIAKCILRDCGFYHWTMTAPAINRPKKTGTNIGGTSHSRSLKLWMIDILTALLFGGSTTLSVTDSSKWWTVIGTTDSLYAAMSREISKRRLANATFISTTPIAKRLLLAGRIHIIARATGVLQ